LNKDQNVPEKRLQTKLLNESSVYIKPDVLQSSVGTVYESGEVDPKYKLDSQPLVFEPTFQEKSEDPNISVINYQELPSQRHTYILHDHPATPSGISPASAKLRKSKADEIY
jgi:hypothetical protein